MQNPRLTAQLRAVFGDTAVDAIKELRCVREPMGCGETLTTICGVNDDPKLGPCVLAPNHDSDHMPVTLVTDDERVPADRRVGAAFDTDDAIREYLVVGMCQKCQRRFEEEGRRAEQREAEMERRGEL